VANALSRMLKEEVHGAEVEEVEWITQKLLAIERDPETIQTSIVMGRRRGYATVETMRGKKPKGRCSEGNHRKTKHRIMASYYIYRYTAVRTMLKMGRASSRQKSNNGNRDKSTTRKKS